MSASQLSERGAAVLDAVVERFVLTGEPVGSVAVTDALPERVSAATVRNVMAELERLGYLVQPHTSAGRMPTSQGYHHYVESLLTEGRLDPVDEVRLLSRLDVDDLDVRELLARSCRLLAELSQLVGLVSAPPLADTVFQHVDFVALDGNRVMAIVVGRNGQVSNRIVQPGEALDQEQLDRAADYLVRRFAGRCLREVAARIRELSEQVSERLEAYERRALALAARSFPDDMDQTEVIVEGTASLVTRPDFAGRQDLQAVIETLERRRELVRALTHDTGAHEPRIVIGSEPLPEALEGCSLVAATYWSRGSALGSVAVLGPTRLEYARAISLVDAMARVTSRVFGRLAGS